MVPRFRHSCQYFGIRNKSTCFFSALPEVFNVDRKLQLLEGEKQRGCVATVVLLIDSNPGERNVLQRALRLRGYAVITATDCSEAIAAASRYSKPVRLILADSAFTTDLDSLVRRVGEASATTVEVLVMCGLDSEDSESQYQTIVRPFTASYLARKLVAMIGEGREDG